VPDILAPLHIPLSPARAWRLGWFGLDALQSAVAVARRFKGERARALFGGAAAHSILRLTEPVSAAAGMTMLMTAHREGWPFPAGGAGAISKALADELETNGGRIETGRRVESMADLPSRRAALFDVTPRQLLAIAGDRLQGGFRKSLDRYRYGSGVFKLDLAIEGTIPWQAEELAAGRHPEQPFVLLAQQSLFDRSRAPEGKNTVWAYCHVPNGSTIDMSEAILRQIERFAPGFRERILATKAAGPAELEGYDANCIGGDITGGRHDLGQLFTRPSRRVFDPYSTSDPSIFICSASTPPGGGVHGMCGYLAARSALKRLR
jgi:phytoene dehydrogenase-like protein